MIIGIKYCGGCNSRYDRAQEVQKLIRKFPQHTFIYATQATSVCAVWLSVCGCSTCCASTDGLVATKKLFILHTPRNFAEVAAFLNQQAAVPETVQPALPQLGDSVTLTKTITNTAIAELSKLSNTSEGWQPASASPAGFAEPAIHKLLTDRLLFSLPGGQRSMSMPMLLNEQLHFRQPVAAGDTLTLVVTLKKIKEMRQCYIWKLAVCCRNQNGEVVVKGLCHQIIVK